MLASVKKRCRAMIHDAICRASVGAAHVADRGRRRATPLQWIYDAMYSVRMLVCFVALTGTVMQAQDTVSVVRAEVPSDAVASNTVPTVAAVSNQPMRIIRADLLQKLLQRTNDFVLIDVMPLFYYQDFHIKGAMSIPEAELAETVENWPRNRRIVVYCLDTDCDTSRVAARKLMNMGFTDVLQYEGGKREWRALKYEGIGKGKLLDE